jgi:hypothetical protein
MDENPRRRNLQKDSLQERGTQRTSHPRWQHVGSGAHCSDLQASARSLGLTLVTGKASAGTPALLSAEMVASTRLM